MDFLHFGDLIFFALVAGILLYRLRIVLGRKDFNHKIKPKAFSPLKEVTAPQTKTGKTDKENEQVKPLVSKVFEPEVKSEKILSVLESIKTYDKNFTAGNFLQGAKMAFEMIIEAFSKGDKETLKNLLDNEIYNDLLSALNERDVDKTYLTTLVSINSADITNASLKDKIAAITVNFVSEQIDLVKDKEGNILEGNPSQINIVKDSWVFSRNVTSSNPNWKLVSTEGRD